MDEKDVFLAWYQRLVITEYLASITNSGKEKRESYLGELLIGWGKKLDHTRACVCLQFRHK